MKLERMAQSLRTASSLGTVLDAWDRLELETANTVSGLKGVDRVAMALAILRTMLKSLEEGGAFASRWLRRWGDAKRQMAQFRGEITDPELEAAFKKVEALIGPYGS